VIAGDANAGKMFCAKTSFIPFFQAKGFRQANPIVVS